MMPPKLGIVAGGGRLPALIVGACRKQGREFFVLALEGQAEKSLTDGIDHAWVRLGALGAAVDRLRKAGVGEVVLAGSVRRPSLADLRPDAKAMAFFARTGAAALGDDGLLTALVDTLESREGFRVVGPDSLLPDLLASSGAYGRHLPDSIARSDIAAAFRAAKNLGAADIGQAAVARAGRIVDVEDKEGTDALLARIAKNGERGGVLVKTKKPGQERRADLPAIGPDTVAAAKRAGLAGIAIEAGAALVLDREALVAAADAAGLFVVGVIPDEFDGAVDADAAVTKAPFVFLIAGEPSGDALGARLMAALKTKTDNRVRFAGIGGPAMIGQGMESLFPMQELAVMGLAEVLPRIFQLKRRIDETVATVKGARPDVLVTIDAPDFCLRVAKRLKGQGVALVHYVAPSVWAWRPGRARKVAAFLDHLMTLLPFEPPYFSREGLAATFVGHPVLESGADRGDGPEFRKSHGIAPSAPLLVLLPGSRRGEISRLVGIFGEAFAALRQAKPGLVGVLPTVDAVRADVEATVAGWTVKPIVVTGEAEKFAAFAAADAALAASGTVALELAMARTPMVVAYKMNPATAWLARRLIRVRFVTLLNLVLDRAAVPELLQNDCVPGKLTAAVARLLDDPAARAEQVAATTEALAALKPEGALPSEKAAEVVLSLIHSKSSTAKVRS